jgi:hypothetical protein
LEGALWLHPNFPSNARIAIGFLKLRRQINFIQHIPLKSLYEAVSMAKSSNRILFVETQNAKNQSRFIGMHHLIISTGYNRQLKRPLLDFNSFK